MKNLLATATLAALLFASCGSNSANKPAQSGEAVNPDKAAESAVDSAYIVGQWVIEEIGRATPPNLRPDNIDPDQAQVMVFYPDNMVGVSTNCNSLGGEYRLEGSSIRFSNMARTEMACDNMEVEEALAALMPELRTVDVLSDTTMLLNADEAGKFVYLRKVSSSAE